MATSLFRHHAAAGAPLSSSVADTRGMRVTGASPNTLYEWLRRRRQEVLAPEKNTPAT
jgi:hypothetical protein